MNKKKILKRIFLVIAIVLTIIVLNIVRKMIIFKKIDQKASAYQNMTNFYVKTYGYQGDSLMIVENYRKDNHHLWQMRRLSANTNMMFRTYEDGEKRTTYIDTPDAKIANVNQEPSPLSGEIPNLFGEMDSWNFVIASLISSVKTEKCNGKMCYRINLCYVPNLFNQTEDYILYFDKETGLKVREENGTVAGEREKVDMLNDYYYEFNQVEDTIFVEPDIRQYEIQEN